MARRTLFHTLDLNRFPPSISNLPAGLTINGQTVYPTLRYNGRDATATTWPAWGYGETLTLQAGTAPTYNNGSPLLGSLDDSVKFNGGGYYQAAGNTFGDIATEDMVIELMFTVMANRDILTKRDTTGVLFGVDSSLRAYAFLQDSSGSTSAISAVLTSGAINHALICMDRSGSCQIYINGVASGAALDISGRASTLTNTGITTVGARSGGTDIWNERVFYVSMWKQASWLDTHLQATVAKTRFAQLTGVYPQQARGTALPTAMTRSTAGYLDKIESDGTTKLYYVGPNWPRVCSRKDTAGNVVRGYLSETESAQRMKYTSAPENAAWVKRGGASAVTTTEVVNPAGGGDGVWKVEGLAGSSSNDIYQLNAGFGANVAITNGLWIKRISTSGILTLGNPQDSTNLGKWTVDFASLPDAWTRITRSNATVVSEFVATASGEAGYQLWCATGYPLSFYAWNPNQTTGANIGSDIPTPAATPVTRTADSLRYKMDDGNLASGKGSLVLDFMGANVEKSAASSNLQWCLSDGGSNIIYSSNGVGAAYGGARFVGQGQWMVDGSVDIWNGNKHTIRATWKTNDARQYVDGAADGTPDASCTIPTGLTQLDVGAYLSAGYECNGLVSNLRINNKPTTKI